MAATMTDRKRTLIFVNIVISCIATSMLITALNTALPAIIGDLGVDVATGQWLTSGYSLVMGIMTPLTAFLITRFATRRVYLGGLIIFAAGLVLSSVATDFHFMMFSRVLQATGNSVLSSMAQVILLSIYPAERHGAVMGWYGLSIGAAPVLAPTLAGIIIDAISWRAIFYITLVIIVASLVCAWLVLGNVLETVKKKFDTLSFVLSVLTFGGVTLGVGNISAYSLVSPQVLPALLVGVATGAFFVYRQFHLSQPFLDLRVLHDRNFLLSIIGSIVLYLVMMGSSMVIPLYVQNIMGYSATVSGLVMLPGSAVMAVISPFAGIIYDKVGIKKLFVCGAVFMTVSSFAMCFVTISTSIWMAAFLHAVRSVAIGCLLMPFVTWGMSTIKLDMMAHATALLNSLRTIAGAIGITVFVGIMEAVTKSSATLGETAAIHGMNISYLWMGVTSLILLAIAIFGVKNKTDKNIQAKA